jgi:hypothetical protein
MSNGSGGKKELEEREKVRSASAISPFRVRQLANTR